MRKLRSAVDLYLFYILSAPAVGVVSEPAAAKGLTGSHQSYTYYCSLNLNLVLILYNYNEHRWNYFIEYLYYSMKLGRILTNDCHAYHMRSNARSFMN